MEVLELARWAPSGDNTQPWRFALHPPDVITVHGHDTRSDCVYDLDGHPSQISVGALLETIVIAATRFGLAANVERRDGARDTNPLFDVRFRRDAAISVDPRVDAIVRRTVARGALRPVRLAADDKRALEVAVAPDFKIVWFESLADRFRVAQLNFSNARIRLTIPEAYAVHRRAIEWDAHFSETGIPGHALGASRISLRAMAWATASWRRVDWLNRYAGGTLAPRLELDLLPGLMCAAHCAFVASRPPVTIDDYVAAGRALQRFWLAATLRGIQFQPEYTPLVFSRYARERRAFSTDPRAAGRAQAILARVQALFGETRSACVTFLGRLGYGSPSAARSLRLPVSALLLQETQKL